ncbi:hypothetical protein HBA54_19235 [Pelagibius litoralis]|uniref:Uncharacterized protein n=1 Tax=Pelagibius litoralis TaxID=374515 RepID=A0A967KAY3_9PROT|nr:hypothetical protein [Pelagibius litoralis]NIA70737.1 hypothetical protein [Pelagibius litoralis]
MSEKHTPEPWDVVRASLRFTAGYSTKALEGTTLDEVVRAFRRLHGEVTLNDSAYGGTDAYYANAALLAKLTKESE